MATAGQVASSTTVNTIMDDIATALTESVNKDGTKAFAANQPMGSNKLTGLAVGSSRTDSVTLGQVQDATLNWVDGGGSANAITATYVPAITALIDGQLCGVRATAANTTTTPTFAPNGLTARTIKKTGGVALVAGDIRADNHDLLLRYNLADTSWELLNPANEANIGAANTFTAAQTIAVEDAATNTSTTLATLTHTTSGTAAASFGLALDAKLENAAGTLIHAGVIRHKWIDATNASEDSQWDFDTMVAGTRATAWSIGSGIWTPLTSDLGEGTVNAFHLYAQSRRVAGRVYKAADETITADATLNSDATLRFTCAASKNYVFSAHIFYESATAADFRFGMTGPTSPTKFSVLWHHVTPETAVTNVFGRWTAYETTGEIITHTANTAGGHIKLSGLIQNGSNAGTLIFTWAQGTSNAGNTTVLAGSWLEILPVS